MFTLYICGENRDSCSMEFGYKNKCFTNLGENDLQNKKLLKEPKRDHIRNVCYMARIARLFFDTIFQKFVKKL